MNGWQVEEMEANARNKQWEDMNAPNEYEVVLKEAAKELEKAIKMLDESEYRLIDASAELSETPMQFKVDSIIDEINVIQADLRRMKECWGRGERE